MIARFVGAALAALSTVTATPVDYASLDYHGLYFRQEWINQPLALARLDPIVQPGVISSHMHSFIGANAIAPTMDFEQTQSANCSQVYVKPDKSLYWMPPLFFQDPTNRSFTLVPEHHRVLYYFNRATNAKTGKSDPSIIEGFPEGFRMIAGDAMLRAPAATQQQQAAIEWFCHGPDTKSSGFPANFTACPNGLAGSVHFPYCWNGADFDVEHPTAHMSYPVADAQGNGAPDSGACPASHPRVLPHLFIEFWFDVTGFDGLYGAGDAPFVLANGDPTGYSFHADFLNGWEPGVLEKAMKTCNIGESGDPLSDCFEVWTNEERDACVQSPLVDEEVRGWLDRLPGCNPVQRGPARATAPADCVETASIIGGSASASASKTAAAASSKSATASKAATAIVTVTSTVTETATVFKTVTIPASSVSATYA
ncbi:uncharacterized protein K452DRAFT_274083 [Aplosporella prunicola CBS 121167]|uniref:DUF1996 domain-containing protein n=1 Tax=Aplosporella prunicola CBS 121167 TaxID=1176127 RepID=A0A6A6B828_9PEZI|nr:uncharacterized protein K452DRAFT_274083 [Aplosporella prunicola CBS 121167]KAF2140362.1 hypothetical protein K452DRAFT_274083 [Aplosporella prunicola CBS 121167]